MTNVLDGWPAASPDLNPIENLRAILKRLVEEAQTTSRRELINVVMVTEENLEIGVVNLLMAPMPR
jgi:transposase